MLGIFAHDLTIVGRNAYRTGSAPPNRDLFMDVIDPHATQWRLDARYSDVVAASSCFQFVLSSIRTGSRLRPAPT